MRLHITTTALGLGALAVLALAGCSNDTATATNPTSSATTHRVGIHAPAPVLLSSAELGKRLLNERDLGEGYTRNPQRPEHNDDVTVIGCPALEKLGGDAAAGGSLVFSRKAKASFTYTGGSNSDLTEELYSDTETKLSKGVSEIVDAMLSCATYQVASGSTVIDMSTQKLDAPRLGDERWSQLLIYSTGGQRSVVKQTAIRTSNILVILSGSPGLVDANLDKALAKTQAAH